MPRVTHSADGRRTARGLRRLRARAGSVSRGSSGRGARGDADAVFVGDHGAAEGGAVQAHPDGCGGAAGRDGNDDGGLGDERRRRLPVARAAVSLGAIVLFDEHDASRRHGHHHGALRSRTDARTDREVQGHARPVRPHHVRAHAEAARGGPQQVRPLVAEGRAARGRAVLGRDQAQDDRLVGADHRRVLRRDRRHGRHVHQLARLARASGIGRTLDARAAAHPRRGRNRTACGRGRHGVVRTAAGPAADSNTTRTLRRRATRSTTEVGRRSATWATSTPTAICSSPIGARS